MKGLLSLAVIALLVAGCGSKKVKTEDPVSLDTPKEVVNTLEAVCMDDAPNGPVRSYFTERFDEVFNDSNYVQYESAERLGIDPIHTLYDAYHTRRPLIKVKDCEHYSVEDLTHSMPFLVPEAAQLLEEIGRDFCDIVEERGGDRSNKIIVTSLLRSPYSVRKLRRVNRNAVDSSTHMFATTFDISWSHFECSDSTKAVNAAVLKGILAEVLKKKREEGRCFVKYEKKSPCFHITVNN